VRSASVFLLYLAKGGYYRQLGQSEGLAECTTMMYLHDMAAVNTKLVWFKT